MDLKNVKRGRFVMTGAKKVKFISDPEGGWMIVKYPTKDKGVKKDIIVIEK